VQNSPEKEMSAFAEDVLRGLSGTPKFLSSRYFYDDEGSRLFQEIMRLPEYYPTRCELEIFSEQSDDILKALSPDGAGFDLIELGAGDGSKTAVLVEHFLANAVDLSYSPIDISQQALDNLSATFNARFSTLTVEPLRGDYFSILRSLKKDTGRRKILLFLGSNIGNFDRDASIDFFSQLREVMSDNDLLFIGFDLHKDPRVIAAAYDDPQGVTAAFNLNLLTRINRELGANFDLSKFSHYAVYRPVEKSARSFLISREIQTVKIESLGRTFAFDEWEAVFMEISQKYTLPAISELAVASGFKVSQNFFDSDRYYCDSLWQPN
jgi:L-histidine Nalpha-methyltransferase